MADIIRKFQAAQLVPFARDSGGSPSGTLIFKEADPSGEAPDDEARTMRFVASDESVDRYGDIILADGWQLENFRRNPTFLFMHNYTLPLGTVSKIGVEGKRLMATVKFAAAGLSTRIDEAWRLAKAGILRAVSVGFTVPDDESWEYIRDDQNDQVTGIRFLKSELLELSLVSVPANPNALAVARALGVSERSIRSALPLDASVRARHIATRQRIAAIRIAGVRNSAPR